MQSAPSSPGTETDRLGGGTLLAAFVLFAAVGLAVYAPAMDGAFLSDDEHYVADNPYIHDLSPDHLFEILDPWSSHSQLINNYAPVHALLNALQWRAFGPDPGGYHVVNVLLHASASVLLAVFFVGTGIPRVAALAGGALFLLHPANVEAVAWISQLKSPLALALSLAALFAHPRRPIAALLLFVLALLAKPSALFAFPVLLARCALEPGRLRREGPWLAAWGVVLGAFCLLSVSIYLESRADLAPLYADPGVWLRTSVGVGLRYLAMAVAGYGLSTFHEPPPADSWLDPWWLGSLVALALLAWRAVWVARARRPEAVFWVWAAASFAPVSGILTLPFPMADRYLYFILPGLIGAFLLVLRDAWGALARRLPAARPEAGGLPPAVRSAALLLLAVVLVGYGARAHERSRVWTSGFHMMADAERNYPDGVAAQTRRATRAARAGRVSEAAEALRAAHARGYRRLDQILAEPAYRPHLDDPRFRAVLDEIAASLVAIHGAAEGPSQESLRTMALAHYVRGETERAIALLERALEKGGFLDDVVERDLAEIRRRERRRPPGPKDS